MSAERTNQAATLEQNLGLSASYLCGMLAIGFLDPLAAFLIPLVSEGVGWLAERYRPQALIINWAGSATPSPGGCTRSSCSHGAIHGSEPATGRSSWRWTGTAIFMEVSLGPSGCRSTSG